MPRKKKEDAAPEDFVQNTGENENADEPGDFASESPQNMETDAGGDPAEDANPENGAEGETCSDPEEYPSDGGAEPEESLTDPGACLYAPDAGEAHGTDTGEDEPRGGDAIADEAAPGEAEPDGAAATGDTAATDDAAENAADTDGGPADGGDPEMSAAPGAASPREESALSVPVPVAKPAPARKKTIMDLDLNALDRNLSEEQMREWSAVYASYRAKSILTGTVVGADETPFDIRNRDTGETEHRRLVSLIVINYRVKILIPESEMWMPGEERPRHVLRNTVGSTVDYAVMEIDREGECAVGSRRVAMAARRHFFAKGEHREGELLKCRVMAVGAKQCTVECNGFDIRLTQRELSYAAIADLREKYRPGQELPCLLTEYDQRAGKLTVSVKDVNPSPFIGADRRHPVGSRRQAVISGKYGGGVFCTLPDDTVCLCLYSAGHFDADFRNGDSVIVVIRQYDYARRLIYGRILAKW